MIKEPIHDRRAGLHHRPQPVAMDELRHRRAAVADELGYLLERHARVRQHRDQ